MLFNKKSPKKESYTAIGTQPSASTINALMESFEFDTCLEAQASSAPLQAPDFILYVSLKPCPNAYWQERMGFEVTKPYFQGTPQAGYQVKVITYGNEKPLALLERYLQPLAMHYRVVPKSSAYTDEHQRALFATAIDKVHLYKTASLAALTDVWSISYAIELASLFEACVNQQAGSEVCQAALKEIGTDNVKGQLVHRYGVKLFIAEALRPYLSSTQIESYPGMIVVKDKDKVFIGMPIKNQNEQHYHGVLRLLVQAAKVYHSQQAQENRHTMGLRPRY